MSSLFDFESKPDAYAVFGNPIKHSKSPIIHNEFARQAKQSMVYEAVQVNPGGFVQAVDQFFAQDGKGLNITIPFKQNAYEYADQLSERAQAAQAVNTLKRLPDNRIFGDNTDGVGLIRDLCNNIGIQVTSKTVLLLGAGGAAKGICAPILEQGPKKLIVANRTPSRAFALAEQFQSLGAIHACTFQDLHAQNFDIIINATAASLSGKHLDLPASIKLNNCFCYDLMYAAEKTAFINWAEHNNCVNSSDGLGMLVEQAAESFYIWRGIRPETQTVIEKIRTLL